MNKQVRNGIIIIGGVAILGFAIYMYMRGKKPKIEEKKEDKKDKKTLKDAYDNLVFEFNKDVIKPISYPYLDEMVAVLQEAPDWKLKLEGHTDNKGNAEYNLNLSKKRAIAVKNYLVKKGIAENRIEAEGFGSTKPIADNSTEEGRNKNRRVEFKIIKPEVKPEEVTAKSEEVKSEVKK